MTAIDDAFAPDPPRPARGRRRLLVGLGVLVAVFALAAAAVVRAPAADLDPAGGLQAGAAFGALGPTTTPVPPTLAVTTTTLPPLPLPDPLPRNPYAPTPEVVLGRLVIPKLGVDEPLQLGMTLTAINRGPSLWPGTAAPGELGNAVVAGHRTTWSKPFHRLDELVAGDQVRFDLPGASFVYEVRGVIVVPAAHIGIAAQSYAHTATLFACHPKGSARERVVAKLRLLDAAGRPVDAESALPPIEQGTDPVTDTTLMVRDDGSDPNAAAADPFGSVSG